MVKLSVSVETAMQRNRLRPKADKHSEDELVRRHQRLREWNDPRTKQVIEIDTEKGIEDTMAALRRAIWQSL